MSQSMVEIFAIKLQSCRQSRALLIFGLVEMRQRNFFVSELKFTKSFSSSNVGGDVVDHLLFRFSMFCFIAETFATKVRNWSEFWTFFALLNCTVAGSQKSCMQILMPASRHATRQSFARLLPLAPNLLLLIG